GGAVYSLTRPSYYYGSYSDPAYQYYWQGEREATTKGLVTGFLVGPLVCAAVLWLRVILRRRSLAAAEKALAAKIEEIQAEFPEQCRAWGGAAGLREPDLVNEVLRDMEARRGAGV